MPRRPPHISTILVDPNTLCREGLLHILHGTRYRVCASASQPEEVESTHVSKLGETLLLVGLDEGGAGALEGIRRLKDSGSCVRTVILADRFIPEHLNLAIKAGADGYLLRTVTTEALIKSLDLVFLGESVFSSGFLPTACGSPDHRVETGDRPRVPVEGEGSDGPAAEDETSAALETDVAARPLSGREQEILRCIVNGASNKHIARQFAITEATVKVHMKAILRKIRVRNRTQAAVWALNHERKIKSRADRPAAEEATPRSLPHVMDSHVSEYSNGTGHSPDARVA